MGNPRMQARGTEIFGSSHEYAPKVGEVTMLGAGIENAEEIAVIWAAAMDPMFPTLAKLRNELRVLCQRPGLPGDVRDALSDLATQAADALPCPTMEEATASNALRGL